MIYLHISNTTKDIVNPRQLEDLLDTHHFHVVFTVPAQLNPAFLYDQRAMYDLLFRAASETVLELCADKKDLGAKTGITGGGLTTNGK